MDLLLHLQYVGEILAAFQGEGRPMQPLLKAETRSGESHTHNIYEKLGVSGRRQVVTKALGLGILGNR